MCKKTLFLSLFWKKEVKLGKKSKKSWWRASTAGHALFFQISHIWPTFIFGVSNAPDTFFFLLFLGKTAEITRYLWKKTYGHQLQPMTHFFKKHKFDLLSYISIINFLNLPVRALIHDLQKKNIQASTRTHDPFFDNSGIWPTFIYRGEVPADTFAKLPVRVLINDPKKKLIQTSTTTHAPFFDKPQIWPTFIFLHHQFLKSSSLCSNSWPTKKPTGIN